MRVMVDANIIVSAGLFPESIVGKTLNHITENHVLVLCKYTLEELAEVFTNKFPDRTKYLNRFIQELKYDLVDIKIRDYSKYPQMRDLNDLPILAGAIESKVDLLVTGDKDFEEIEIEKLKIIKPKEYIEKFMK